ncbi:retrotransposon hot spot (RHS) protein [Trypanosoma cruzi]|nr:retrotransposon hot spot (RHS) protein [Trypanosoma cruzi]
MHRCCGVYDFCSLRLAVAVPSSLPTCGFVRVRGAKCPRPFVECVRCRRCHTGAGPWRAGCVDESSVHTTLLLLFALTNTVLGEWHPIAVVAAVLVHFVCISHHVGDSRAEAVSHSCAYFILVFLLTAG